MTGEQIKTLIDALNMKARELMTPNFFILNNELKTITDEISRLQSQCPHQFEDGYCNYCYKAQEENI